MINVSLVFPPFYLASLYNLPPLGLVNLATVARDAGCRVTIHDFALDIRRERLAMDSGIYAQCADMILSEDPRVVAFSAQCTTYPGVIRIAEYLKNRNRDLTVVIGGHNACFVDRETLQTFPWVDVVVRGEGEITFRELMTAVADRSDLSTVSGITYRQGGRVIRNAERPLIENLDDLPMPDYGFLPPFSEYRDTCGSQRSVAILEVGRGCPHQCIYCSESSFWRRRSRTFSVGRLVAEMRYLSQERGAECFLLSYDQFTANREFVRSFCSEVIGAGLNHLPWYCISRLDSVDASLLELMRRAGCESMCYGIDSGSARTLAFIHKKIDENVLYKQVRETTDQGMVPTLSFVIGFPEEEKADVDETLTLALKTGIQGNSNPLVQLPTVLPGTELYRRYLPDLVREVDSYFSLGIEFDGGKRLDTDEALIDGYREIFSSFYNLPTRAMPIPSLNLLATYFPLMVTLFPKSMLMLGTALARSPSDLFFEWMNWLKSRLGRDGLTVDAPECFKYFPEFAGSLCDGVGSDGWDHLPEMVAYETKALEAGRFSAKVPVATADMTGVMKWRPLRRHCVISAGFKKNLPEILSDMKAGIFRDHYPDDPVFLVFYQEDTVLEVMEINEFGIDFLDLCDGDRPVSDIAEKLFPVHGQEMGLDEFTAVCEAAANDLSVLKLLRAIPAE